MSNNKKLDAQKFLQGMKKKHSEILKKKQEDNLREVTKVERFIRLRKEVAEIEITETNEAISARKAKLLKKKQENLNNHDSDLKKISNLHLKVAKLTETIKEQDLKLAQNQKKIEILQKPTKEFSLKYTKHLESLQEELKLAEAKLYVLQSCENLSSAPEAYENFLQKLNSYVEPVELKVHTQDAWFSSGSGIGKILQENYQEIKSIEKLINDAENLLRSDPEQDEDFMKVVNERLRKEQGAIEGKFRKKLEKKLGDLEFLHSKDLNFLKIKLEELESKISINSLKFKQ